MASSYTQQQPLPQPPSGSQYQYQAQYPPQQPQQQQPQQPQQQQHHQQQQPQRPGRERRGSKTFSLHSDRSHKSGPSHHKIDLHETSAEKESHRLHSKADPTLAMQEAEPSAVQAGVKSSLASLREGPQRDAFGNAIVDPDRSNPTRSRWERPLDTIRSFEAAIDGGYSRKSFIRSDTESVANWNRRNSYVGGNNGARFPQDSYYGGRPGSVAPMNNGQYDWRQPTPGREFDQQQSGPYSGGQRQRFSRVGSEAQFTPRYAEQSVYPTDGNHRSYETVASGSGSGGSAAEAAGYQTDPTSSDNSSFERMQGPPKRHEPTNDYGIGFNQSSAYQAPAFNIGGNGANNGPPVPQHAYNGPPVPNKESRGMGSMLRKQPTNEQAQSRPPMNEKRKSWFSKRFSKQ